MRCAQPKNHIRHFEEVFYEISEIWEQSEIVRYTGCLIPCHYTKYELASQPFKFKGNSTRIGITLSSTQIHTRTEQSIYTFTSFIAEFGGALSLFLGVSFMNGWDAGLWSGRAVCKRLVIRAKNERDKSVDLI